MLVVGRREFMLSALVRIGEKVADGDGINVVITFHGSPQG